MEDPMARSVFSQTPLSSPTRAGTPIYEDLAGLETSQIDDILDHFQYGGSLTQGQAWDRFGCARLAARVWDLRQLGYPIRKRMVRDDQARLVAEYYMGDEDGA
jgi:hypothetical protein